MLSWSCISICCNHPWRHHWKQSLQPSERECCILSHSHNTGSPPTIRHGHRGVCSSCVTALPHSFSLVWSIYWLRPLVLSNCDRQPPCVMKLCATSRVWTCPHGLKQHRRLIAEQHTTSQKAKNRALDPKLHCQSKLFTSYSQTSVLIHHISSQRDWQLGGTLHPNVPHASGQRVHCWVHLRSCTPTSQHQGDFTHEGDCHHMINEEGLVKGVVRQNLRVFILYLRLMFPL